MLKEYIINLMDVNQEEMGRYVEKLKKLQQEYQTGQEWIANLQKENDLEQNIFSPRIAAAGGLEKLAQAQEKQQAIEKEIEEVIRDNKHTFGYDREVQFQEETISQYAEEMAHKLFTKAIEMGNIRFDEELPGYVDEFGMQINEYDFKLTKLCRDAAKVELLEEYNAAYKAGYNCDGYISTVIERCELLKNSIRVRRDFLSKISCPDANEPTAASFTAYLQIEDKDSIINKLRRLPIDLPTKMYGAIITALIANGTMRPIADGERGAIYRALRDIYNDRRNIGTRQGVTKYICTDLISPLDIESANSYLQ